MLSVIAAAIDIATSVIVVSNTVIGISIDIDIVLTFVVENKSNVT